MVLTGLTKYREAGLLLLRIGIGIIMIAHGWPKLIGGPDVWEGRVGASLGLYGINHSTVWMIFGLGMALLEVLGGLIFVAGFLFRPICILFTLAMLGAASQHMFNENFPPALRNFANGWGQAITLAVLFFCLILIGPGKYSVDKQ